MKTEMQDVTDLVPRSATKARLIRPNQIQIERELEVFAQIMDNQFALPVLGWRFGMNAIIDLIPGIGDIATSLVALYVLISAVRYRVPKITLLRMGLNILIYFMGNMVPWVGDLFGAWWKPNLRNLSLLRKRATVSAAEAKEASASDWLFVGIIILGLVSLLLGSMAVSAFIIWLIFRPA
jgi:Domain of unknown function (DUF4112)